MPNAGGSLKHPDLTIGSRGRGNPAFFIGGEKTVGVVQSVFQVC
jgi:hypothetical protein